LIEPPLCFATIRTLTADEFLSTCSRAIAAPLLRRAAGHRYYSFSDNGSRGGSDSAKESDTPSAKEKACATCGC
jgi:hypothetical protein